MIILNLLERCQPIVSEGMILKYTYNGERVDGSNPVLPGTRVKPECNTISHKLQNPEAYRPKVLICLSNGIWNDKIYFECAPSNLFFNFNLVLKVISVSSLLLIDYTNQGHTFY